MDEIRISFNIRFEVFTAVTMKNTVFWDIATRSFLTGNASRLRYKSQAVNAMYDLRVSRR
jgi:hypothetical protein